jgi:hypothetical protein
MTGHPEEFELALYASGDLDLWRRLGVGLHLSRCGNCRRIAAAYRGDRAWVLAESAQMPEGLDWDGLSSEMTANIRVGLAAGECVAPKPSRAASTPLWKPLAVAAGLTVVLGSAWWLNVPAADNQKILRAFQGIGQKSLALTEERGPKVVTSANWIEVQENGSSLGVGQPGTPLAVSVDAQGSASARYVDTDTGQVTITSVYVQ